MAIIGIDLGGTNSLVCICRNGRVELIPNNIGVQEQQRGAPPSWRSGR